MESLVYNESIDTKDLNEQANMVESFKMAMDIIEEYKDMIETNKKNIIFLAYQQGKKFRKFKITKGTIIFKMNIVNLVKRYPKMMTSSVTLNFLKSYYKDIKNICKKNQEDFK